MLADKDKFFGKNVIGKIFPRLKVNKVARKRFWAKGRDVKDHRLIILQHIWSPNSLHLGYGQVSDVRNLKIYWCETISHTWNLL